MAWVLAFDAPAPHVSTTHRVFSGFRVLAMTNDADRQIPTTRQS